MQDAEMIDSFIIDSREMLDEIEPDLIELQQSFENEGNANEETLNNVFRLFHSLKGAASFLQLKNVTTVTHEAETLLNQLREEEIPLGNTQLDVIFQASDFIRTVLAAIEEKGSDEGFESEADGVVQMLQNACKKNADFPEVSQGAPPIPEAEASGDEKDESTSEGSGEFPITSDMKKQFIEESEELLDKVEQNLLSLEETEAQGEILSNSFRHIHSFKGNCGFFGYADMERLSHTTETVLDQMKNGVIRANGDNINILLKIVDTLRGSLADIAQGGEGKIKGCDILIDLLNDMIPHQSAISEGTPEPSNATPITKSETSFHNQEKLCQSPSQKPLGEILVEMGETTHEVVEHALKLQGNQKKRRVTRRDIRVDLDKLNELNDLVGELVTAQAMVIRNPDLKGYEFENFEKAAHHLEQISSNLQDVAMSLRMVPISGLFRKMIRLVHDLSRKSGKKVKLEMKGEETEVDKTLVELISDPLVHIIRNAVDHGIESLEERRKLGKEGTGTILLEAKHEGGEVWITVTDDGKGLDRDKILKKAVEKGLIPKGEATLTDKEVYQLIFEPGFSTAEKVTDISGRGVGMDVVKRNIEQIKGRVDIQSIAGQGTTISIRIPLTLAIIDGMLVRSGESRYLIPILAIKESFRPKPEHVTVMPGGQKMVKVREDLIPVARLSDVYNLGNGNGKLDEGILITLENQGKSICLFVDEIVGQMETVIKGLPGFMGNIQGISGCTILGDGEVSLILDVRGLIERARH